MPRHVVIDLFGGFDVHLDDQVVAEDAWVRRRPMELVQLLALSPRHLVVRDQAIDALWPHLDLDAGAANLRKTAHRARQVLGSPDAVVLRAGHVALFPDASVTTDLEQFQVAAAAALADADPRRCAEVAAAVRGELLPGSPYEEWAAGPRRHAHRTLLSLLRAAGGWERIVELDPTDERAYQELMRAALDRGARAEALRWFGEARSVLATQLGVRPEPDTERLHDEAVAGLVAPLRTLVGRDVQLARAASLLGAEGPAGIGALVVCGAPGIGKSAFCREVGRALDEERWAVRWTDTAGVDRPYGPLTRLIEEILIEMPSVAGVLDDHARAVLVALGVSAPAAPPIDGSLTRHQAIGAVTQVLRAAADGRRTLLVLDDGHDSDAATLDVVVQLATSVRDVTVVVAFRPGPAADELVEGLGRVDRAGRAATIDLGPLDRSQATHLVHQSTDRDDDDEAVRTIVDLGAGNPFAIGELARSDETLRGQMPQTVAASVMARLVDLDADTLALVQRLALASDDIDSSTVVALTGATEAEAFEVLDRSLRAGVLVVAGSRYRFRHDLVRQALVAQVAPHRRLAVHRDAARRLASAGAAPAMVAQQWLAAERPGEALRWSVLAARGAVQVGAFLDARRHLASVLEHEPTHHDALLLDAQCLDLLGDSGTLAAYDRALAVAEETEVGDLTAARALAQIKQGDPAGGLRAIEGAEPRTTLGRLNEALAYAGAAALGATDPSIGTAKAAECRRIALTSGDRAGLVIASWAHAAAAHARGDLHDSVLADLRETKDLPELAVRMFDGHLCMTQRFLYGSRPYAEVIAFAEDLTAEAERLGAARGHAFGVTLRGEALYLSGRLEDARSALTTAVVLHRETGGTTGEAHAVQRLSDVAHRAGRLDDAAALLDEALDLTRTTDVGFHLLDRVYGSRISSAREPREGLALVEEAEQAVRGPLETCPGCRIHLTVPAAIAAARAGDLARAEEYESAADYLANVVMRLPAWYAAFDEVRAHVAVAKGDPRGARPMFGDAADRYATAGQPLDEARCRALS